MKLLGPKLHRVWLAPVLAALFAASAQAQLSYLAFDNQTGHILEARDRNAKLQVGSLVKIATAMVVLDWVHLRNKDLSGKISIDSSAFANGVTSPAGLQPGDSASLRDLLYCALLSSDNVAANALAKYVGSQVPNPNNLDPVGNFVSQMNALARSLHMRRTLFLNPTGHDNMPKGQALPHSTAEDIARLVRHAYNDAAFKFYVAQKTRTIHILRDGEDIPVQIRNTNELLGRDLIDGVKTGSTRRAGQCLVLSAERSPESRRDAEGVKVTPRRVTVVLLGSTDRARDGIQLLRRAWSLYDAWVAEGRPTKKGSHL
jgi:D-alanyl-D-alanine carboxypeptidase (penicillin-binding protein 5/6)